MEDGKRAVSLRIELEEYWDEMERRVRRAVSGVMGSPAEAEAHPAVDVTGLIDLRAQLAAMGERLERLERRQIIEAPAGEAEPSERLRYLEEQEPEIVALAREIGVDFSDDNLVRLLGTRILSMADAGRIITPRERESPIHQATVKDMIERRGLPCVMKFNAQQKKETPHVRPIDLMRWHAARPGEERFVNKDLAQPERGEGKKQRRRVR